MENLVLVEAELTARSWALPGADPSPSSGTSTWPDLGIMGVEVRCGKH